MKDSDWFRNRALKLILLLLLIIPVLLLFIQLELYAYTIAGTFLSMILISIYYIKFPSLILHYVNPFMFLHLQSFVIWQISQGFTLVDPFVKIFLTISIIAFFTFNIVVLFFSNLKVSEFDIVKVNPYVYNGIKYLSLLALIIYLAFIFGAGELTNKRQIKDYILAENPSLGYLYALSNLFLVCVFYELLKFKDDQKKLYRLIILYGAFFMLIYFILGERDLLFSFCLALFFMVSMKAKRFVIKRFYLFIVVAIFIGPYTQLFKSVFKDSTAIDLDSKSFATNGFDDFMTTGANTLRVYRTNGLSTVEKNLIADDIGNVLDLTLNSGRWYNREFLGREIGTTGFGFSLPLTGFMDLGYFGVFIVYLIVASIVGLFFNHFRSNIIGLAFIIFIISLISYVQRQDLAYVLNFSLKFILIPYLVLTKFKLRP